jgi:hypothetical protein
MPRKTKPDDDAKTHFDPEQDITQFREKMLKKANKHFKEVLLSMKGKLKSLEISLENRKKVSFD